MRRKYVIILPLILSITLCACGKKDNNITQEAPVTITQPAEATITTTPPTPTMVPLPTATVAPTQIPPTLSPKADGLAGYTPLGVKIERTKEKDKYTDYIFLNANEGWKASYDPMGMFKEDIVLSKTVDGGSSWNKLTSTEDKAYTIPLGSKTGLIFIDSMKGFTTIQIPKPGYVGLYRTTDSGSTWEEQKVTIPDQYSNAEFLTNPPVFFTKSDALLLTCAVGDTTEPVVFASHDGGGSWKPVKEHEDNSFQWSFTADKTQKTNGTWTVQFNRTKWTSDNAIVWVKSAIDK